MSNDKKDERCEWYVNHTPYGFPLYATECGEIKLNYTTGIDIYCNSCGRKIKIVDKTKSE